MLKPTLIFAIAALLLPAQAQAYGWPIKPFNKEHAVAAHINDPRFQSPFPGGHWYGQAKTIDNAKSTSFHNGIDIPTHDGTPVYAVAAGRVTSLGVRRISVRSKGVSFEYWHIRRIVHRGQKIRLHQKIGYVATTYGHLHLSEIRGGKYINPLRRGAISPYHDQTAPTAPVVSIYDSAYRAAGGAVLGGVASLTTATSDAPNLPSARWPWAVTTPAALSWNLSDEAGLVVMSSTSSFVFNTRVCLLTSVFAPGTMANNKDGPGIYNYWVLRDWDTAEVQNGQYTLTVTAKDIRDNESTTSTTFTITN